jgi:CubicO group peptidase (beta-lactamase class C family)
MAATLFSIFVILFSLILLISEAYFLEKAEADTGLHSSEIEKFDEVMKLLMQRANAPGAQLAVAKGGQLKYFKAFGFADRDNGEAVTTKNIMRYNSFSKVITGTAILKLVQVRP